MKATRLPVATNRLSATARCFVRHIIFSLGLVLAAQLHAKPLMVFIRAGQSNLEVQTVVDLEGLDDNEGRGTLATLLSDPEMEKLLARI